MRRRDGPPPELTRPIAELGDPGSRRAAAGGARVRRPWRILITAGATRTHLDDLRFLTNPATGRLGRALAELALRNGAHVTYLHGVGSSLPATRRPPRRGGGAHRVGRLHLIPVVSCRDAFRAIRSALRRYRYDVIFHTMGVEDFEFSTPYRGKLSSRIKVLKVTLVPTPKIIEQMRRWAPRAFLLACKLESAASRSELLASALALLRRTRADIVLANDWTEIRHGPHQGYLILPNGEARCVSGKSNIAKALWTICLDAQAPAFNRTGPLAPRAGFGDGPSRDRPLAPSRRLTR